MNQAVGYTGDERRALADVAAFLDHCLATGEYDFATILRTLDHDVQGLGSPGPSFVPRTRGYAERRPGEALNPVA